MVSAWANQNNLVLGLLRVNDKSNEITAIPELLETLMIKGNIITIDAMGTQTNIANKIIENGADYILAVKGNQKELLSEIKDEFKFSKIIENKDNKWNSLKQIVKIESIREFKNSDKPLEKSTRYYITSLNKSPKKHQEYIRSHWGVENKLHWTLDVAFSEDASRKRNKTLLKIILYY